PEVRFTGEVLAKIYLGDIKKWNDPALQNIQAEGVTLPDLDIIPVARADGSGTSYIFTDYMQKVCGQKGLDWKPGPALYPDLGKHVSRKDKSGGLADFIKKTRGALGYVEMAYALHTRTPFGAVQNSKGKYIKADVDSVTEAETSTPEEKITEDLCF